MPATITKIEKSRLSAAQALLAAIALLLPAAAGACDDVWELRRQEGSIQVYARPVADSSSLAVKATVLIDASVERVSQLMGDGSSCAAWRTKCKLSEIIETVSERELYLYMVLNLPWPAADRDIVVHSITDYDPQTRTAIVKLQSDSSRYPLGNYVRAESTGQFVIKEVSDTQVEFTYIMHTELGGNLPVGMVNSELVEATFDDISLLQQLAENRANL